MLPRSFCAGRTGQTAHSRNGMRREGAEVAAVGSEDGALVTPSLIGTWRILFGLEPTGRQPQHA